MVTFCQTQGTSQQPINQLRESRSFVQPILCVRVTSHVCQAGRKQNRFCNARRKAAGCPAPPQSRWLAPWCRSLEGTLSRGPPLTPSVPQPSHPKPPGSHSQSPPSAAKKQVNHTKQIDHVPASLCAKQHVKLQMPWIFCTKMKWWFNMKVVIKNVFVPKLNLIRKFYRCMLIFMDPHLSSFNSWF